MLEYTIIAYENWNYIQFEIKKYAFTLIFVS